MARTSEIEAKCEFLKLGGPILGFLHEGSHCFGYVFCAHDSWKLPNRAPFFLFELLLHNQPCAWEFPKVRGPNFRPQTVGALTVRSPTKRTPNVQTQPSAFHVYLARDFWLKLLVQEWAHVFCPRPSSRKRCRLLLSFRPMQEHVCRLRGRLPV